MLTTFETDELIVDALRAGASGYLGKGVEPQNLLDAIRSVAAGDSLLSTATRALIARVLAQPIFAPARTPAALAGLTPASERSSPSSPPACPTTTSLNAWSSVQPPPRHM